MFEFSGEYEPMINIIFLIVTAGVAWHVAGKRPIGVAGDGIPHRIPKHIVIAVASFGDADHDIRHCLHRENFGCASAAAQRDRLAALPRARAQLSACAHRLCLRRT